MVTLDGFLGFLGLVGFVAFCIALNYVCSAHDENIRRRGGRPWWEQLKR